MSASKASRRGGNIDDDSDSECAEDEEEDNAISGEESDEEDDDENGEEDEEDGDNEEIDLTDVLEKVFILIRKVSLFYLCSIISHCACKIRKATQARKFFEGLCRQHDIKAVKFKTLVRTRFGSLYDVVVRFISLKSVSILILLYHCQLTDCFKRL
jgi:hypothetical protein